MLEELTSLVSQYGLWIVFIGMMTEGTMMIIVSGVMCYLGMLSVKETIPVAIMGALIGDQFWYCMGRCYGQNILNRFPLLKQRVQKLEYAVKKRGIWLAFSGRFIYSGAILFPVTLGTYKYLYKKFTLFNTLGIIVWSLLGISLGYLLGTGAEQVIGKIRNIEQFVGLLFIIAIFTWFIKPYFKSREKA
jgi:membrane protein DedA with SNARE-associated domain